MVMTLDSSPTLGCERQLLVKIDPFYGHQLVRPPNSTTAGAPWGTWAPRQGLADFQAVEASDSADSFQLAGIVRGMLAGECLHEHSSGHPSSARCTVDGVLWAHNASCQHEAFCIVIRLYLFFFAKQL